MEKKLKFSEFAELIGTTAKTVYKMEEREEIITVTEKVNNRLTRLVVTNDEQIEYFKNVYRKNPVNNYNCEDMLPDNEETMKNTLHSQNNKTGDTVQEIFDKMLLLNDEYINRLNKVTEQLTNEKARVLYLEDKASREGMYINQINDLNETKTALLQDKERLLTEKEALMDSNKRLENEREKLKTRNNKLTLLIMTVIIVFLLVIVGMITYNVAQNIGKNINEQEKGHAQQEVRQQPESMPRK